jgi:hypothetical protein
MSSPPIRRAEPSLVQRGVSDVRQARLARSLGWLGIAIGAAQVLAPRHVARAVGAADRPLLIRALGARELASGPRSLAGRLASAVNPA